MNIVYLRLSENSQNFSYQEKKIIDYCKINKIKIDEIIREYSNGYSETYTGFLQKHNIEKFKNPTLIIYNYSRISRHAICLQNFLLMANELKINIIEAFPIENNNIYKDLKVIHFFTNVSNLSREYISKITKDALKDLKEKGIKLGAPITAVSDEERKTIVDLFKDKASISKICEHTKIGRRIVDRILREENLKIGYKQKRDTEDIIVTNNDIDINTKYLIWADIKIGLTVFDLVKKYKISREKIEECVKFMKGGAHW